MRKVTDFIVYDSLQSMYLKPEHKYHAISEWDNNWKKTNPNWGGGEKTMFKYYVPPS